jgi:hypothetical protein
MNTNIELRRWLAFGTGVGIEIGPEDLNVVVVRVRPSGASVITAAVVERFRERPAAEWGTEYASILRKHNVAVNAVAPGPIITPRFVASRPIDEAKLVQEGTLERYGWPREIANAVEFLVADATTFVTGQILRVDGGIQTWAV